MDLLRLESLKRAYGERLALEADGIALPPGAVGLLGPNGAGKSTLVQILMGLLPPSSGRAEVLGLDVASRPLAVRARVGYMSENECFIPGLRAVDQVALAGEVGGMPRRQAHRRAHEVLGCLGVEESRYRRVEELSTGVKQRVALAAALVHDPELLVLDEPTNGLDPSGRQAMLALIRSLHRDFGKSIILSSHLLEDIDRVCDSVLILHRGRILAHGRIDVLRAHCRNRYRLRLRGEAGRFAELLRGAGAAVALDSLPGGDGTEIVAEVPAGFETRRFFELVERSRIDGAGGLGGSAAGNGLLLCELVPDEEKLEDLFARLVSDRSPQLTAGGQGDAPPARGEARIAG